MPQSSQQTETGDPLNRFSPLLQGGETLEPVSGHSIRGVPAGGSHPSLLEGESLEPIARSNSSSAANPDRTPRDTGFVHGLIRGGRNIIGTAKQFGQDLGNPKMPVLLSDKPEDQGSLADRMQGDTMVNRYLLAPAAREKQRSLEEAEAMHRTHGMESLGHGITSMLHTAGEFVPVFGPMGGSLLDRAREGDVSGAIGEGTTYAVAPRIARATGARVIGAGRDIPGLRTLLPTTEDIGRGIGRSSVGSMIGRMARPSPAPRSVVSRLGTPPLEGPVGGESVGAESSELAHSAPRPSIARPVTENPVVGNFVRAMDKAGVPISARPSLVLKGSGRVRRILGPNEDLTDIMSKSVRQVQRSKPTKD